MGEEDNYETINGSFTTHLIAGASAGIMEFCLMFPIDTVKTRMQSISFRGNERVIEMLIKMMKQEGLLSPIRGISAIAIAAGPAHGLYFANYEFVKENLKRWVRNHKFDPLCHGIAGCCATFFHDFIMNPSEVVKQRMQMKNSVFKNTFKCAVGIYKNEGIKAFYRSFFTTLMMNIPFQTIHFMIYEICQNIFNKEKAYNPGTHVLSGGIAGGIASAITNPLDVCKTLLNTQEGTRTVETFKQAAGVVFKTRGAIGFFGGVQARMLYTIPSTAICWFTYEFFKFFLQNKAHNRTNKKEQ